MKNDVSFYWQQRHVQKLWCHDRFCKFKMILAFTKISSPPTKIKIHFFEFLGNDYGFEMLCLLLLDLLSILLAVNTPPSPLPQCIDHHIFSANHPNVIKMHPKAMCSLKIVHCHRPHFCFAVIMAHFTSLFAVCIQNNNIYYTKRDAFSLKSSEKFMFNLVSAIH